MLTPGDTADKQFAGRIMSNQRVIKKYANRRLYDSTGSRHVTLDDLRKMIVSGDKVKVIDDKSGEDLTRAVLLQVISEQEQFGTPVLSIDLLESIIRFYGNQQAMRAEMAKVLEGPMAPIAEFARQNMEQWSKIQASMMSAFTHSKPSPAPDDEKTAQPDKKPDKNKK